MSAPRYSSRYYDEAEKEYKKALADYSGDAGVAKAKGEAEALAKTGSQAAAGIASDQAISASRTAGMSRGAAAANASTAAREATTNTYQNLYNQGYQNQAQANQQVIANQQALLSSAADKDKSRYQAESSRYGAAMGAAQGGFSALASIASDERTKVIAKREELLKKLKGEF